MEKHPSSPQGSEPELDAKAAAPGMMMVAFYLVVLAFFIMLNSMAKFQNHRTKDVLGSLRQTFSNVESPKTIPIIRIVPRLGSEISVQNYFGPFGILAKEHLDLEPTDVVEYGNTMQITADVSDFFVAGTSAVLPTKKVFLDKLADEVTKMQAGAQINLEFVFGSERLTTYPDAVSNLEVARAGMIARHLVERGVVEGSLYIGVSPEKNAGRIIMTFHRLNLDGSEINPNLNYSN